ncbi:MAG: twin-arginine translocase TatA/TatE family subunit [Rudaea sp.]
MGAAGFSHWIIVALIVVMLFGSKRLGSLGGDLGAAIKSFRKSMHTEADDDKTRPADYAALGKERSADQS